jgi:hypothetical protein
MTGTRFRLGSLASGGRFIWGATDHNGSVPVPLRFPKSPSFAQFLRRTKLDSSRRAPRWGRSEGGVPRGGREGRGPAPTGRWRNAHG